jgi:putative membrane protein
MMIISMVLGAIIGELIDFDRRITAIGEWLKLKTGNSRDPQFTNAFITASMTFTVGAMGVIGSIQDGLTGDYSTMVVKSILDGIIVMVMASSMGKGALFSFLPVGIIQGIITGLAHLAAPLMTPEAIDNLSYVGSILIFCVGINVLWPNKIRVANLLPAIFIAMLLTFLPITL